MEDVDYHTETITLDDEIVIRIPGFKDCFITITRRRGDRKKLMITMPKFMKAFKDKKRAVEKDVAFRVVS